jgi:hypothetical protein
MTVASSENRNAGIERSPDSMIESSKIMRACHRRINYKLFDDLTLKGRGFTCCGKLDTEGGGVSTPAQCPRKQQYLNRQVLGNKTSTKQTPAPTTER